MSATERIVIVGGGAAGLSAARGYRSAGGTGTVTIVTDDDRPPYRRPPLTKEYLRSEIEAAELPLEAGAWYREQQVELVHDRAAELDIDGRRLKLATDGTELTYDGLVLATGAAPVRLPVPGADDDGVLVIRSAADSDRLKAHAGAGTRAAVIGTGFIGCEAAASLAMVGLRVTVIGLEPVPQDERLGREAGRRLHGWLEEHGVKLALEAPVDAIERRGEQLHVSAGDQAIDADFVLMASGVAPRTELARAAGLRLGGGGVAADAAMRTTGDRVFAAGDICEAHHPLAGRPLRVEHWGDALAQGEVAGRRLAGQRARWETVPGFWSTIGRRTLKYAAWGDGFDDVDFVDHGGGPFTAWYAREGKLVGVLAHDADDDYERGKELIAAGAPPP